MTERMLIYVVGPYRADSAFKIAGNISIAHDYGIEILKLGHYVFIPHKHTAWMDGAVPDKMFLEMGLHFLTFADAIFKLPGWNESRGSLVEIEEAERLKLQIFHNLDEIPRVDIAR